MDRHKIAFIGPKGAGKSTTLVEIYYHEALRSDKQCVYLDLVGISDDTFRICELYGYIMYL